MSTTSTTSIASAQPSMVAMVQVASPASPHTHMHTHARAPLGRTRSAAARAIIASNAGPSADDGSRHASPAAPDASAAAAASLPSTPASPQRRTLLEAFSSLAGSSSGRRLPPPPGRAGPSSADFEAQAGLSATHAPRDDERHFAIGDEDDGDNGEDPFRSGPSSSAHRPSVAQPPNLSYSSSSRSRQQSKVSDSSSSEYDHIGSRHTRMYDDDDDDDADDDVQYASMAEPRSEYTTLLQLKPLAGGAHADQTRAESGSVTLQPPVRLLGEDEDEDDYGQHPDSTSAGQLGGSYSKQRQYSPLSSAPHTADRLLPPQTASTHAGGDADADVDTDMEAQQAQAGPALAAPFEPMSRAEKTWMWAVTALVTVLIVVALLISEDVIDWPGDGIGKD